VSADISTRDVLVLGKVCGNISATDRVDIRSEVSVVGDVIAQRISVGDGACFEEKSKSAGRASERCLAAVGFSNEVTRSHFQRPFSIGKVCFHSGLSVSPA
jgi:cytoskeletal protein CcmA (bactofilin family)